MYRIGLLIYARCHQYIQYGYDFAHRYRNVGIFIGFIALNYTLVMIATYLTKVRKWKRD